MHYMKFVLPTALLLTQPALALSEKENLELLLGGIDTELLKLHDENGSAWRLKHDLNFPCMITVQEQAVIEEESWTREYRFELSDMETGWLLRARDNRRAISYYAEKTDAAGSVKTYVPKKINALTITVAEDNSALERIQAMVDAGIQVCIQRNAFPGE